MGQIANALATPVSFQHAGKEWKLSPWDYGIQGKLERYLEQHAIKVAREMGQSLPESDADKLLRDTRRDIAHGMYTFGSDEVAQCLKAMPHLKHLTYLMLQVNHPEIEKREVEDMFRDSLDSVLGAVTQAISDPNRQAPAIN